jgi:hypothetical protein
MRKIIIVTVCLLLTALGSFSQTRKTPVKPSAPKTASKTTPLPIPTVSEIPSTEWSEIVKSLQVEDWDKTAFLTGNALKSLKFENDKKQLARLNYFYLFSLAGKVAQGKMTAKELDNIAQAFIGKDFVMLDRNALANCNNSLNYACPVKNDKKALRVTATNKEFTIIHSFEYVKLLQEFNFVAHNLKNVFVGGTLQKAEVNQKPDKVWIMRLSFKDGWAQIADKK